MENGCRVYDIHLPGVLWSTLFGLTVVKVSAAANRCFKLARPETTTRSKFWIETARGSSPKQGHGVIHSKAT